MTQGHVIRAFGNLIEVQFEGDIRQGEVAYIKVDNTWLKSEVIEIVNDVAKVQVFEDTRGVRLNSLVEFSGHLLEAELGPGLLSKVVDGLQNPLNEVALKSGLFLERGVYLNPLDRSTLWDYTPVLKPGDKVKRGDVLGTTPEGRFTHHIMVPFSLFETYTLTWVIEPGSYTVGTVIAKIADSKGQEIPLTMIQRWPIKSSLQEGEKLVPSELLETGLRIIDTQFPIMKGGAFCTPGPFGAGKTVIQHHLSKYSNVDVVVFVACGERAGEVVEILKEFPLLKDPYTGDPLINRTAIICNTSSMPVAARESSIYLGMTIAEYYRQMGLNILLLADSTSRWAQALREMSARLEEIPGEEAFPAYLASRIADFYERSGVLQMKNGKKGSITLCGAVSPAGGNFEEPVTQSTLSVVGAFLGLSRERSDSRRYPAIDPLISWSKYCHSKEVGEVLNLLQKGQEIAKRMEVVGIEGTPLSDFLTYLKAELYDFSYLQQNAFDKEDAFSPLSRQKELFELMLLLFKKPFTFLTHDQAREFFLNLQSQIKNLNFMPYRTKAYEDAYESLKERVI